MPVLRMFCFWLVFISPLAGESLRIASYNLQNYLIMNRRLEEGFRPDYPKPEAEKAALREAILQVHPDIIALQEIGDEAQLKELQRDLKHMGLFYPYCAIVTDNPDKTRHIAILSRLKPDQVTLHGTIPFTLKGEKLLVRRGLLELHFTTGKTEWRLYAVHLKSRLTENESDPNAAKQRAGEARAIRNLIEKQVGSNGRYLVAGDFNDTRNSSALARFLHKGKATLSRIIECYDSREETWTHHYAREETLSRVDFILISPALDALVRISGHIWEDRKAGEGSDHRLIYVDMEF